MNPDAIGDFESHRAEPGAVPVFSIVPYLPLVFGLLECLIIVWAMVSIFDQIRDYDVPDNPAPAGISSPVVACILYLAPASLGLIIGIFALARSARYSAGARVLAVVGTVLCGTFVAFPLAALLFPRWW
jgi:hypothetical protein